MFEWHFNFSEVQDDLSELKSKTVLNRNYFTIRSESLEVFLGKRTLKICRKCRGQHPCRSGISIKLRCNNFVKEKMVAI